MKNLLTFIYLASWVPHIYCRGLPSDEESCYRDGDWEERCLPDKKGYGEWWCTEVEPHHNVWVQEKITNCTKPLQPTCRCFENDWYEQECECVNTRPPPSFPPTGVIRWNGTSYYDDNWWVHYENPRTVYLYGEVHKDKNGRYLMKKTKLGKWSYQTEELPDVVVVFEIIIPKGDGKTYIKYTGNDHSGECSKDEVSTSGQLDSIWPKHLYYAHGEVFRLVADAPKAANINAQQWEITKHVEDGFFGWKWYVEYDSKMKYAIPTKYFDKMEDGFVGTVETTERLYMYEPIKEGDESFKVEDYCSNV